MPKTMKGLVNDMTKAADGGKFLKFLQLLAELLAALTAQNAAPTAAATAKGTPTEEEVSDCCNALEDLKSAARAPTAAAKGAKAGLLGGKFPWSVLIPIAVDFAKELLEKLAESWSQE